MSDRRKNILVMSAVLKTMNLVRKIESFSNLLKFLGTIVWMKCFIKKARKLPVNDGPLCATEIQEALR